MKLIEIKEPIWKDRSVGLNVQGLDANDQVMVKITYIEKGTGKLLYPGTFVIQIRKIREFPLQNIKGVNLNIVPINVLQQHVQKADEYNPKDEYSVVDNWECASQLDEFHGRFILPLAERVEQGWEFMKSSSVSAEDAKMKEKHKLTFERLKIQLESYTKIYNAAVTLVKRHENLVNEIARHYINIKEDILHEGSFPKELLPLQIEKLNDYYNTIKGMLKHLNFDEL